MSEPPQPNAQDKPDKRKRRIRWWLAVAILAAVAIFAVLSARDIEATLIGAPAQRIQCPSVHGPTDAAKTVSHTGTAKLVTAKLLRSQREEVDFGRSLTTRIIVLDLGLSAVPEGPASFHLRTNEFVRADDASLRPQDIVADAWRDGRTLVLDVCFYRNGNPNTNLGNPGSYAGTVTIDDSRLSVPVSIPIVVTMQYTNGAFLLWLYFFAIVPGAWCVWIIREKRDGYKPALSLDFLEWIFTVNGIVSMVAGSVAAFAVYVAVYLRDPTWGSSALQPLTLYGGMFSAFVTTSGLASLTDKKMG